MKATVKLFLENGGEYVFGPGRAELLRAIDELGSLHKAAQELGMSYRWAWGRMKNAEKALGVTLLGRGGSISAVPGTSSMSGTSDAPDAPGGASDALGGAPAALGGAPDAEAALSKVVNARSVSLTAEARSLLAFYDALQKRTNEALANAMDDMPAFLANAPAPPPRKKKGKKGTPPIRS